MSKEPLKKKKKKIMKNKVSGEIGCEIKHYLYNLIPDAQTKSA